MSMRVFDFLRVDNLQRDAVAYWSGFAELLGGGICGPWAWTCAMSFQKLVCWEEIRLKAHQTPQSLLHTYLESRSAKTISLSCE